MAGDAAPIAFPMTREAPLDPPPELTRLREEEPLTRVTIWDGSCPWLVTQYDDVREVLNDNRLSAEAGRPGFPTFSPGSGATSTGAATFFSMDPPEHDRYRRMLTAEFSVRRVEAMRPKLETIADELLDQLTAQPKPADLIAHYAMPMPSLVTCSLLGVPYGDHEFFQRVAHCIMSRSSTAQEKLSAGQDLRSYMGELVISKDKDPSDDLLGRLITEHVRSGALTVDELADIATLLLAAGHETTASMLGASVLLLLAFPDELELLRSDPSLIGNAIEECLRYMTVNHLGRRRVAKVDMELHGQTIKAGEGVIAAGDVANRDQKVFDHPEVFDIRRSDVDHHVSFGFGIHQCLGQNLARAELQIAVNALIQRFPQLQLAASMDELSYKHDAIVYGVESLPVTW